MNSKDICDYYMSIGFSRKTAIEMAQKAIFQRNFNKTATSKAIIRKCVNKPKAI